MKSIATALFVTAVLAGCGNMSNGEFNYKLQESLRILNQSQFGQRQSSPPAPTPINIQVNSPAPQIIPVNATQHPIQQGNLVPNNTIRQPLTDQYHQGGQQMCRYADGTVINNGFTICPLSR